MKTQEHFTQPQNQFHSRILIIFQIRVSTWCQLNPLMETKKINPGTCVLSRHPPRHLWLLTESHHPILHGRVTNNKVKKENLKRCGSLQGQVEEKIWGLMKPKWSFLSIMQEVTVGRQQTRHLICQCECSGVKCRFVIFEPQSNRILGRFAKEIGIKLQCQPKTYRRRLGVCEYSHHIKRFSTAWPYQCPFSNSLSYQFFVEML